MKFFSTILLGLLLLTQVFSKWLMVLEYNINKDYIAALCINKERPKLQCKGKCQLLKKMAAEESNNTASGGHRFTKAGFSEISINNLQEFPSSPPQTGLNNYSDKVLMKEYAAPMTAIFHPPAVA